MAFTENCSLFGAVHEDGVNRAIRHIMRQRPSLFNYATPDVVENPELWCSTIDVSPDVTKYGNPIFTIMEPLPLLGADSPPVAVGFCAQLTKAKIDFHPGNAIGLPADLSPPLKKQHLAMFFQICAAIECPPQRLVDRIPVSEDGHGAKISDQPSGPPIVLPGQTNCFCLDVVAVGHVERRFVAGSDRLVAKIDNMDIVDIEPAALEANIICYLETTVNVVLREKLTIAIKTLMLSFPLFSFATVTLAPTPDPPIPHNPAVEDDLLKVFVTMTVV